jgi:hypothetical protein
MNPRSRWWEVVVDGEVITKSPCCLANAMYLAKVYGGEVVPATGQMQEPSDAD